MGIRSCNICRLRDIWNRDKSPTPLMSSGVSLSDIARGRQLADCERTRSTNQGQET